MGLAVMASLPEVLLRAVKLMIFRAESLLQLLDGNVA